MKYLKQEMEDSVFKQATLLNGQTSIACLKFLFFPQLPWYRIGLSMSSAQTFSSAQPQQHLSLISHTLTLTYQPAFTLNVTASAERSIDAKGSEAPGSILHHFSQLGHIYSPPQTPSYYTSVSDPICIHGKFPGEWMPRGMGKTECDKHEGRREERIRQK